MGFFEAWAIYRDDPKRRIRAGNERADMRTRTPAHSHHSELHRLFLGGLLPSRARVRFAGSLTVRHHMTLMQPHLIQLSPFPAPGKNRSCEQNAIGEDGVSRFRFRSGL